MEHEFISIVMNQVVPHDLCDEIITMGQDKWEGSVVGLENPEVKSSVRKSDVAWIAEKRIQDIFWSLMQEANVRGGWNFDIRKIHELQLTRYTAPSDKYDYHVDFQDSKIIGDNVRKLSMTCLLNDDFVGGKFQFNNGKEMTVELKKGDVLFFPSFYLHRVKKVTKGTRYSLVVWYCGEYFK